MNRIPSRTFSILRSPSLRPQPQVGLLSSPSSSFATPPSSSAYAPSTGFPTSFVRSLSVSASNFASEAPRSPFDQAFATQTDVPLFDRIQAHPEVLRAIETLSRLAREKTGVDLAAGDRPTVPMMMKLAQDKELKEAATHLMVTLKDAGINVDPRQAFAALKTIGEGFDDLDLDSVQGRKGKKGDGEQS